VAKVVVNSENWTLH